jgi:hypothetical protein
MSKYHDLKTWMEDEVNIHHRDVQRFWLAEDHNWYCDLDRWPQIWGLKSGIRSLVNYCVILLVYTHTHTHIYIYI